MAPVIAGIRVAVLAAPALPQLHPCESRHEIELRGPDVSEGRREVPRLAVDEPIMVWSRILGGNVDLVEAEVVVWAPLERDDCLARLQSLPGRNHDFDSEPTPRVEMSGNVADAFDLAAARAAGGPFDVAVKAAVDDGAISSEEAGRYLASLVELDARGAFVFAALAVSTAAVAP